MTCGIDPGCYLWEWFLGWPWWAHLGLIGCIALLLWGFAARLWAIAKGLGGWQAAVGAVGVFALVVAVLWPKARRAVEEYREPPPTPIPKRRKRPTISDLFR
jgi:hypothetical protein